MEPTHSNSPHAATATLSPPVQRTVALIIEDHESIANLLGVILAQEGLRTRWCQTGAEALAVFAREQAEIAFVYADCRLPDGDGRTICQELRRQAPDLPLLLSSGNATLLHPGPLGNREGLFFLPKPFAPAELLVRVRRLRRESSHRPW